MIIRIANCSDTPQIAAIFYNTVQRVNIRDYTKEQVNAWAPKIPNADNWKRKLNNRTIFVADDDGTIAGFAELEADGHIDCFYCHHQYQRKGVGSLLYKEIEKEAHHRGLSRLFTEASITAKPFFESKGFSLIKEQSVTCRNVAMTNYKMEKKNKY